MFDEHIQLNLISWKRFFINYEIELLNNKTIASIKNTEIKIIYNALRLVKS